MNEHDDIARKNRETSEHGVLAYRAITARARRTKRDLRARVAELDKLAAELLNLMRSINLENSKLIIEHGDSLRDMQRLDDRNVQQVAAANATIGGLSRGLTRAEEEIRRLSGIARRDLATMREQGERIADLEARLESEKESRRHYETAMQTAENNVRAATNELEQAQEQLIAANRDLARLRAIEAGHPSTSEVVQGAARILAERATATEDLAAAGFVINGTGAIVDGPTLHTKGENATLPEDHKPRHPVACGCSTHRTTPRTDE